MQFLDVAGDGPLDVVQLNQPNAGFFERDDQAGWSSFTPFVTQPNIEWDNRNLRFVDLTGDGHADSDVYHLANLGALRTLCGPGYFSRYSVQVRELSIRSVLMVAVS